MDIINNKSDIELYYQNLYSNNLNSSCACDSINSSNCYYCLNYMVIPPTEISNFIKMHLHLDKKHHAKYLIAVFKLCGKLLPYDFVMGNKILRNIVYNYFNLQDKFSNNISDRTTNDIQSDYLLYNNYILNNNHIKINSFVYNIYFNQPNLEYDDYFTCSLCKVNLCPMHLYLSNIICNKCNYCNKKWLICGWCKPLFNEFYGCKYIHKLKK